MRPARPRDATTKIQGKLSSAGRSGRRRRTKGAWSGRGPKARQSPQKCGRARGSSVLKLQVAVLSRRLPSLLPISLISSSQHVQSSHLSRIALNTTHHSALRSNHGETEGGVSSPSPSALRCVQPSTPIQSPGDVESPSSLHPSPGSQEVRSQRQDTQEDAHAVRSGEQEYRWWCQEAPVRLRLPTSAAPVLLVALERLIHIFCTLRLQPLQAWHRCTPGDQHVEPSPATNQSRRPRHGPLISTYSHHLQPSLLRTIPTNDRVAHSKAALPTTRARGGRCCQAGRPNALSI